jgi:hypothetical protein
MTASLFDRSEKAAPKLALRRSSVTAGAQKQTQHFLGRHEAAADLPDSKPRRRRYRAGRSSPPLLPRLELRTKPLMTTNRWVGAGLEDRLAFAKVGNVDLPPHPLALLGRQAVEGRMVEIEGARHGR